MPTTLTVDVQASPDMQFTVSLDGRKQGANRIGTGAPETLAFTGAWDPTLAHELNMRLVGFSPGDVLRVYGYGFDGITRPLEETLDRANGSFNVVILPPVVPAPAPVAPTPSAPSVCSPIKFWAAIAGLELGIVTPASTIAYFIRRGMGGRITVKQRELQPVIGGPLDPTAVGNLLRVVGQFVAAGQPCSIDFHDYAKPYGAVIGTAGTVTWAQWMAFLLLVASLPGIRNEPLVRLELMNEPQMDAATWFSQQKVAVDYLMAAGVTNMLVLSITSNDSLQSVPWQGEWVNDPASNVRPAGHAYGDAPTYSGVGRVSSPFYYASMGRNVITGLRQQPGNRWPVAWMEIGFSEDETSYAAERNLFNLLQRHTDRIADLGYWMGGKEVALNQPGVAPKYVYDVNPETDGTDAPQIAVAREYMPGGRSYLLPLWAQVGVGFTVAGTVTFADGAMTGGQAALPGGQIIKGGTAFTKRIRFVVDALPSGSSLVYLVGDFNSLGVQLDGKGSLHFSCGASRRVLLTATAALPAGPAEHVVEIGADGSGIFCFLNGAAVASSPIAWAATEPVYQGEIGLGGNGKAAAAATLDGRRRWFELFDYVANKAAHEVSATRPQPGDDPGRICFAPLETDLSVWA